MTVPAIVSIRSDSCSTLYAREVDRHLFPTVPVRSRPTTFRRAFERRFRDWKGDTPPAIPWTDSVLYEIHVKGATQSPTWTFPKHLRGTYAGLCIAGDD